MVRPDSEMALSDNPDIAKNEPSLPVNLPPTPWTPETNSALAKKYAELVGIPDIEEAMKVFLDQTIVIEGIHALGMILRPQLDIPRLELNFFTDLSDIGDHKKENNIRPQMAECSRVLEDAFIDGDVDLVEVGTYFVHGTSDNIEGLHAGNFLDNTVDPFMVNHTDTTINFDRVVFSTLLVRPKSNEFLGEGAISDITLSS